MSTLSFESGQKTSSNPVLDGYFSGLRQNQDQYVNPELIRKRAFHARAKSLENLDKLVLDFESHFNKNQGRILWASQAPTGKQELLKQAGNRNRVFSQQHRLLSEMGILKEKPSNWHFFDEGYYQYSDINRSFPGWARTQNEPKTPRPWSPESGDTAILFPEFIVSENGALALYVQDPFVLQLLAHCERLIFVAGIEQVAATMAESELFLNLLSTHKYGMKEQGDFVYTFGHAQLRENEGPREVHLLLLDNGRTEVLAEIPQRQALYCIHCGACQQHSNRLQVRAYDDQLFSSVIDAVKAPFVSDFDRYIGLSFEFPLSGWSTSRCPVNIDIKNLILENRHQAVERKSLGKGDSYAWVAWKTAMMSRKWLNKGATMKNFTLRSFFKKSWGEQREFPKIQEKSFNELWIEQRGKGEI